MSSSSSSKRARWASDLSLTTSSAPLPDLPDRLTSLPDTLRLHILSFLPLKSAIIASSLNSLWLNLWPHRFHSPYPSVLSLSSSSIPSIDQHLLDPDRALDVLHLSLPPGPRYDSHISRWLSSPPSKNLSVLHLHLNNSNSSSSSLRRRSNRARRGNPEGVVSSLHFSTLAALTKLVRFTISGINLRGPVSTFRSPAVSLEFLLLHDCPVTDSALKKIVANCPVLRSVEVWGCGRLRNLVLVAASCRLENVVVGGCGKLGEITISAVGLRSFRFLGGFVRSYSIEWHEGLEDVYMSTGGLVSTKGSNWVQCFGGFSSVRFLTFCSLSLQYISAAHSKSVRGLMVLQQLRELQLLMSMMTNSNLTEIYRFFSLYGFPRLEKIFVELPTDMNDQYLFNFLEEGEEEPQDVEFPSLKIVKMNNFKFHKNEIQLVKFLLEKANSLEWLIIIVPQDFAAENGGSFEEKYETLHSQLAVLTRASADCQIILSDRDDKKLRHKHSGFCFKI